MLLVAFIVDPTARVYSFEAPTDLKQKRKKTKTYPPLSCKIEYLLTSNHNDGSIASEFFTDDDGNRDDQLHGVRCRNAARPSFVFKVSPPEVAHIEEGIGLLAIRFCIRHSDPICGDVRRPDAKPLVWMSVRPICPGLKLSEICAIGDTFS